MIDISRYHNRNVLVTGHTGFKGSWLCRVLQKAGAQLSGYSLEPPTYPSLFEMADLARGMRSISGDVRDLDHLKQVFRETQPEIVIHMAAQPIVRTGYRDPVLTYETNVMGTVNVLECIRQTECVRSAVIVTTDKVYRINDDTRPLLESDPLGGADPYAASKSCAELVTDSYRKSWFQERGTGLSTLRAGNAIGGGDFGEGRIIPDCIRAVLTGERIRMRHPEAKRPYQHVLDPVVCYLYVALKQLEDPSLSGSYNIGPEAGSITTEELVQRFCQTWNDRIGSGSGDVPEAAYDADGIPDVPETCDLSIATDSIQQTFGWRDQWAVKDALEEIVAFTEAYRSGQDVKQHMDEWIERYLNR